MSYLIRNEIASEHRRVEEITREAFWNVHVPGCDEHYLASRMRDHEDFVSELDYVLLYDDQVIGNIMYTRSHLIGSDGREIETLTFGPVSILPEFQRRGFGSRLIEYSMDQATKQNWAAIVIYGNPSNYVGQGFKSCKRYDVTDSRGGFPSALLVKELIPDVLKGSTWTYRESSAFELDLTKFAEYEATFPPLVKEEKPSQEEFFILSNSVIV